MWALLLIVLIAHSCLATSIELLEVKSYEDAISGLQAFESEQEMPQNVLEHWVDQVFELFANSDVLLTPRQAEVLIKENPLISLVVSLSPHKTTDALIQALNQATPKNTVQLMYKQMILVSPRNKQIYFPFSKQEIKAEDKMAAPSDFWYSSLIRSYDYALSEQRAFKHLSALIQDYANWYTFDEYLNTVYYAASYIHPERDRGIKLHINRVFQHLFQTEEPPRFVFDATLVRSPTRVAIISQFWFKRHSVYRIVAAFAQALKDAGYQLTLVNIGELQWDTDTSMFDEVKTFEDPSDLTRALDIAQFCHSQNFGLIWYPAIGMSWPDVYLANRRLAPVQIATHGHSVSTHGAVIDYWISGAENEPSNAQKDFSERLVLLPGAGVAHVKPGRFTPTYPAPSVSRKLVINWPFTPQKINYPYLLNVKKMLTGVHEALALSGETLSLVIQVLPNAKTPLLKRVLKRNILNAIRLNSTRITVEVVVLGRLDYPEYMAHISKGDLCFEAYWYGAGNTMIDCLWAGVPMLAWRGHEWNNRVGSGLLDRMPAIAPSLVAENAAEYIQKGIALLSNATLRTEVTRMLRESDIESVLFGSKTYDMGGMSMHDGETFVAAVKYLWNNHNSIIQDNGGKKGEPIVIQERLNTGKKPSRGKRKNRHTKTPKPLSDEL